MHQGQSSLRSIKRADLGRQSCTEEELVGTIWEPTTQEVTSGDAVFRKDLRDVVRSNQLNGVQPWSLNCV
jgi:hypothetical protein